MRQLFAYPDAKGSGVVDILLVAPRLPARALCQLEERKVFLGQVHALERAPGVGCKCMTWTL